VFIYWGWESAVNLSEETEDSARAPGLAGLASTVILVATYVLVAVALIAYAGLGKVEGFDEDAGVLGAVSADVLGSDLGKLLVIAVIVSGISSAQTTILPGSRTSLSMAVAGALPRKFSSIHPRFLTPAFGTIVVGALATAWYVPGKLISENFLFDSLSALSLMIAFYYGLTGLACAIYWRRELLRSAKNFIFIGLAPLIGGGMLFYLLYESARDLADPNLSYTGTEFLGLGMPLAIAIVFTGLGFLIMVAWRLIGPPAGREFFARRRFEAVPHEVAIGELSQVEAIGVSEAAADAGIAPSGEEAPDRERS
jgi:amino acid transporter